MKTNYLKIGVFAFAAASLTLGTVSCKKKGCTDSKATNYDSKAKKDDKSCKYAVVDANKVKKSGHITSNETWKADKIYCLDGKVIVDNGVTLTIEPGTIVKGAEGEGTLASALVVAKGGKLMADGTADKPIVFTSVLDNIAVGQKSGTNLDETDHSKWGGVIILGKAPISAEDGNTSSQIEGIPATSTYGAFGGADATDNSGSLQYVSIRHGGALIGAGNEINGLTLGGVGSGTTIKNIEIIANKDDGIEFFGGSVNVTNIVVGFQGDDGIDIDMSYSGTVDNFIVVNGSNSDEAMEIDGPEGDDNTDGRFTAKNGNCYVSGGGAANIDLKSKAQGTLKNVKIAKAKLRASYQNNCADAKTDAYTHFTQSSPTLTFDNVEFSEVKVYTKSENTSGVVCSVPSGDQSAAAGVSTSGTVTVPATSTFSWTWMSQKGKF